MCDDRLGQFIFQYLIVQQPTLLTLCLAYDNTTTTTTKKYDEMNRETNTQHNARESSQFVVHGTNNKKAHGKAMCAFISFVDTMLLRN